MTARHRKGHGIHSPFIFRLISEVVRDRGDMKVPTEVLQWHEDLRQRKESVETGHFGAGSHADNGMHRSISDIARYSGVNKKYGKLLYRLASWYQPAEILELGTGIGQSTAYLRMGAGKARMITVEGEKDKSEFAASEFQRMAFPETEFVRDNFDHFLQNYRPDSHPWLVFLDGDHDCEPTLRYFAQICRHARHDTMLIIDDIHWSEGMEKAWAAIKSSSESVLTVDLFFMGLVFFREGVVRQDFVVNF